MSYQWAHRFEDGQVRMACSKCGVPYRFPDELEKLDDGYFYCKRKCKEETVLARDKKIAQSRRRREMPPPKFTLPVRYQDDYLGAEGQIFSFVCRVAPFATESRTSGQGITGAKSTDAAAWAANYMADVIVEAKRPAVWISMARTTLKTCCDYILTQQYGAPTGPSPGTGATDVLYGGVITSGTILATATTAVSGAALVRAYQLLGDATYLAAADRCATFLRHMQCGNLDVSNHQTTYPVSGSAYYVGGFTASVSTATSLMSGTFAPINAALGLWFLNLLLAVRPSTTTYGEASGAFFSATTVATIATMMTDAATFLTVGPRDSLNGGATLSGVSATTPRESYSAGTAGGAGTAAWTMADAAPPTGVLLNGDNLAVTLWGLAKVYGVTAQVASVYDWLVTGVSNPTNQAPSEDASKLAGTVAGSWSPLYALAPFLDVLDGAGNAIPPKDDGTFGSLYSWAAAGFLAAISSQRQATAFEAAKNVLSVPQPRSDGQGQESIGPLGSSGLSFQPWTNTAHTSRNRSVRLAAQAAMMYRYSPKAFGDVYSNPSRAA